MRRPRFIFPTGKLCYFNQIHCGGKALMHWPQWVSPSSVLNCVFRGSFLYGCMRVTHIRSQEGQGRQLYDYIFSFHAQRYQPRRVEVEALGELACFITTVPFKVTAQCFSPLRPWPGGLCELAMSRSDHVIENRGGLHDFIPPTKMCLA